MAADHFKRMILLIGIETNEGPRRDVDRREQAEGGVKLELVKADADLFSDSFNDGPMKWWSNHNYGSDVAPPKVIRMVEEEADLRMLAETDKILEDMGWELSDSAMADRYGTDYVRKATPSANPEKIPSTNNAKNDAALADEAAAEATEASFSEPDFGSDQIDRDVDAILNRDGFLDIPAALSVPLLNALATAKTIDEINEVLDGGMGLMDDTRLIDLLTKAKRAAAVRGLTENA